MTPSEGPDGLKTANNDCSGAKPKMAQKVVVVGKYFLKLRYDQKIQRASAIGALKRARLPSLPRMLRATHGVFRDVTCLPSCSRGCGRPMWRSIMPRRLPSLRPF